MKKTAIMMINNNNANNKVKQFQCLMTYRWRLELAFYLYAINHIQAKMAGAYYKFFSFACAFL